MSTFPFQSAVEWLIGQWFWYPAGEPEVRSSISPLFLLDRGWT